MIMGRDELIKLKNDEYNEYLRAHKTLVKKAWIFIKNNESFLDVFTEYHDGCPEGYIAAINENIQIHDDSLHGQVEFNPCRKYLFPINKEEKDDPLTKESYNNAMKAHYRHNPHHWQFCIERKPNGDSVPLDMSSPYVVEMICDIIADIAMINNSQEFISSNDLINFCNDLIKDPNVELSTSTSGLLKDFVSAICKGNDIITLK